MKKCIITVVGKDKVGIIAGVCQYLSDISVNILLLPWVCNFTTFKQKPLRTQILKK